MRKYKLLPSIFMLMLCMGILTVGAFALNPISNSISGTISVSAGKASLAITGYVDNTIVYSRTELHGGMDWTIDSSKLNFEASNYCFAEDVPEKEIKLVVENLTDISLGVFFCDSANVNANESNIKTTGEIKSNTDSTKTIINAKMDYYKYIAPANANNTFDQAEMTITLSVASLTTTSQTGSFTYYLNIEEYDPELNATDEFVKISDTATEISSSYFENSTSITKIIIPSSVIKINDEAFYGCTSLTEIIIPSSVTTIGDMAFQSCTSLKEITIPSSVTAIGVSPFSLCTNLTKIIVEAHKSSGNYDDADLPGNYEGTYWVIEGNSEPQYSIAYSTTTITYVRKTL